jgi:hypothetical protein
MPDFADISFNRSSGPGLEPPRRSGPPWWPIISTLVLLLAAGALWYFVIRGRTPPPAPQPVAQTTVELPRQPARRAAEPGEAIDLPPLDQSDAVVRMLIGRLSSHPVAAAWLTTDGLIRNLTVVVANIADGQTPAKHLRPIRPAGSFATKTSGGLTWIDPASYRRYDGIADAVDGLDARGVARFYATVKPRIDDAYHDLIGPDANFDRTLERAIVMLLRTPVVDEDVQLRTGKVTYPFANPALEDLPKAQRQFLRMGPRNVRIVKAKLRAVAGFLGIPDEALPQPDGAAKPTPSKAP